jgi:hypothetical protein
MVIRPVIMVGTRMRMTTHVNIPTLTGLVDFYIFFFSNGPVSIGPQIQSLADMLALSSILGKCRNQAFNSSPTALKSTGQLYGRRNGNKMIVPRVPRHSSLQPLTTSWHNHYRQQSSYSYSKITQSSANSLMEPYTIRSSSWYILAGLAGAGAAFSGYQQAQAEQKRLGESRMTLEADPWKITGPNSAKVVEESKPFSPDPTQRFFGFLWSIFRIFTGIALAQTIYRAVASFYHQMANYVPEKILKAILGDQALSDGLHPEVAAEMLSSYISDWSKSSPESFGEILPLTWEERDALPISLIWLARPESRPIDHIEWTAPYLSTQTFEETFLCPQFYSFLAKSKKDGCVYHVHGFFSCTTDYVPMPLMVYYSKVATSMSDLQEGKVIDSWVANLTSKLAEDLKAEKVIPLDKLYRASFLRWDLDRLISAEDWIHYLGDDLVQSQFTAEKPLSPQNELFLIRGQRRAITVSMQNAEAFPPVVSLDVIFPETSNSLERHAPISAETLLCARWCDYIEKHPRLHAIVGDKVKVVSSPTIQNSHVKGEEYIGTVSDIWFTCAGDVSSAEVHFRMCRDEANGGRLPFVPVLSVWAENEEVGRVDIYHNHRQRYSQLVTESSESPMVAETRTVPYMVSNFRVMNR